MRVLFLNFNPVHNRVMGFAKALVKLGHTSTVISVSRDRRFTPKWSVTDGVRYGAMPNFPSRYYGYAPLDNLLRLAHMTTHRYDVIHAVDHKPNTYLCGYAGRKHPGLFVADWLDLWGGDGGLNAARPRRLPLVYQLEAKWEVESKLKADGVATISHFLRERAIALGCTPERVICLPNGCDTSSLPALGLDVARAKLGVPVGEKIIGYLGMGINTDEMALLMRTLQHSPSTRLMVIGPPNPAWQEAAGRSGVTSQLWQTGYVANDDVHVYLSSADVLCTPLATSAASQARLAGKLMSYMIAGRPSVVTPVGETARVITDNNIGLVAGPDDYPCAVQSLLDNPAHASELGHNARHAAETDFSDERLTGRLVAFYNQLRTPSTQADGPLPGQSQGTKAPGLI